MSTRCNIIIKEPFGARYVLYHHHDGYPEGVGVQLRNALGVKNGESIPQTWGGHYLVNDLIKNRKGLNDNEYEATWALHSDIEYVYVVNYRTRTLRCYEIPWDEETHQDFTIRFDKVFRRKNLVDIPAWDGSKTMYEE